MITNYDARVYAAERKEEGILSYPIDFSQESVNVKLLLRLSTQGRIFLTFEEIFRKV